MEERPDPVAGPGEAVARIIACGMGLTIQHTRIERGQAVRFPCIIGHAITAEIIEVGSGIDPDVLQVGDAVPCYFYITCGYCKWCRLNRPPLCANFKGYVGRQIDGAYADYMKAPASCFIRLPEGLGYKEHPGTEICPFDTKAALTIHERLEKEAILGRAVLMIREGEPG